jgi:hypothetical protein
MAESFARILMTITMTRMIARMTTRMIPIMRRVEEAAVEEGFT